MAGSVAGSAAVNVVEVMLSRIEMVAGSAAGSVAGNVIGSVHSMEYKFESRAQLGAWLGMLRIFKRKLKKHMFFFFFLAIYGLGCANIYHKKTKMERSTSAQQRSLCCFN